MNNKGFTLIELIMIISVLAMIALLSTPNVLKMIEKNKADNYNSTIDAIVEAAELYASNNRYNLDFVDKNGNRAYCSPNGVDDIYTYIELIDLINNKDISSPVKNSCTDEEIPGSTKIKIILNCGSRLFSYDIEVDDGTVLKRKTDEDDVSIDGIEGLKLENSCDELY